MAISRAQLLKELLPGLNALFGDEYAKYDRHICGGNNYVHGLGRVHEGYDSLHRTHKDASDEKVAARHALGCETGGDQ